MEIRKLDNISSTNDFLLSLDEHIDICAVADYQSAGKGMAGNTWESEPGKNLLFSLLIHPEWLPMTEQFLMSMAHALALYDVLAHIIDGSRLTIKWPNDIYYDSFKLSGTRIDVNTRGMKIQDMVIGTGININQTIFRSDAPNPISLAQITKQEYDCNDILHSILERHDYYSHLLQYGMKETVTSRYHNHLYHRKGFYKYRDAQGTFLAELVQVAPNGIMTLRRTDDSLSHYELKEVSFISDF